MSRQRDCIDLCADDASDASGDASEAHSLALSMSPPAVGSSAPDEPLSAAPFGSTLRLGDLVDFALPGHAHQLGQMISVQPGAITVGYLDRDRARTCAVIAPDSSDLAPPLSHSSLHNRAQAKIVLEHLLALAQADPQAPGEVIVIFQAHLQSLSSSPEDPPSSSQPPPSPGASSVPSMRERSSSHPTAAANRIRELEQRVVQLESALRQSHEQSAAQQAQIAQLQSEMDAAMPPAAYDGIVLLDSGSTHHCCPDRRLFRTLRSTPPHPITGFSGEAVTVTQKGEIVLTLMSGGQLVLSDVSFSEEFQDTLISVPQLASAGYHTSFDDKRAILTKGDTVCVVVRRENKYLFDICSPGSQ